MKTMQFLQSLRSISTIPSEVCAHIHTYFLFCFFMLHFPPETHSFCLWDQKFMQLGQDFLAAHSLAWQVKLPGQLVWIPETNKKQHYLQYLKQMKNSIIYNTWNKQKTALFTIPETNKKQHNLLLCSGWLESGRDVWFGSAVITVTSE